MAELSSKGVDETELTTALADKADVDHDHLHGSLDGLSNDDHPQYHNDTRGDARYYTQTQVDDLIDGVTPGDGGGVSDHGDLTGLGDDDHPQYHNDARGDARYYTQTQVDGGFVAQTDFDGHDHALNDLSDVNAASPDDGQALVWDDSTSKYIPATINAGGVTDHGALTGKGDDDHTQYHNDTRGDARYYTQAQVDAKVVTYLHKSADYTAKNLEDITVDCSGGAVTISAPASPSEGDIFWVKDLKRSSETNSITVDLGADGFEGTADEDYIININGFRAGFKFADSSWWEF